MSIIWFIISWFMDLFWIALLIAIFDKFLGMEIEENQGVGAFLLFVIPTLMEVVSHHFTGLPFIYGI